jgi:hypothetical protein
MKQLALPMLIVLVACEVNPLASDLRPDFRPSLTAKPSPITTVSVRPQRVTLEFIPGGQTAEVTFKARFTASSDPTAQMDGAILVVSAVDGPMPVIGGEELEIAIETGLIESTSIRFEGIGVARSGRVVVNSVPVTGVIQATEAGKDALIWNIRGGDVWEVRFSALTKIGG